MFEHATLQEAYTGALIAGKGKTLNNINIIMERRGVKHEDWVRVRFGAGTPWRRCWCVISPPDEKEVQKLHKDLKKKSVYDRSRAPIAKGCVHFYDTKKTKKTRPIATITDAYSVFAIYPQSKPLIDVSTLIKVEGVITIHGHPPSSTEGFVFVMPEVHPAVSGFEMMLRWLFPVFDTFGLYGRPGRLVADTIDPRSLMFAMPKERRYGYLDVLDVSTLLLTDGSNRWREADWRHKMKEVTSRRMTAISGNQGSTRSSRYSNKRSVRGSLPYRRGVAFEDGASIRSSPSVRFDQNPVSDPVPGGLPRTDSAPPAATAFAPPQPPKSPHHRSVSEAQGLDRYNNPAPPMYSSTLDGTIDELGPNPPHHAYYAGRETSGRRYQSGMSPTPERVSSEDERVANSTPVKELQDLQDTTSPEPVAAPPGFTHAPGTLPVSKPYHSAELRREKSRMSTATMSQITGDGADAAYNPTERPDSRARDQHVIPGVEANHQNGGFLEDRGQTAVLSDAYANGMIANGNGLSEGLLAARTNRLSNERPLPPLPTEIITNHPIADHTYSNSSSSYPDQSMMHMNKSYHMSSTSASPGAPLALSDAQGSRSQPTQGYGHTSNGSISSQNIARKPLPRATQMLQQAEEVRPMTASSNGSLDRHLDKSILDLIRARPHDERSGPLPTFNRPSSRSSSYYEDNASSVTPDYASTRRSVISKESFERPRAGVMRTVGTLQDDHVAESERENMDIPDFDFGPTINYVSQMKPDEESAAVENTIANDHLSRNAGTGEAGNSYQQSSGGLPGRSVPWQPSTNPGAPAPTKQVISPEEFVKQRAMVPPRYAHNRSSSQNMLRSGTPTPPLTRNMSSDKFATNFNRNSAIDLLPRPTSVVNTQTRRNSADLLQRPPRPSSMGPTTLLNMTGDFSNNLSAREQEHVARMTGQPLLNMASNSKKPETDTAAGLVGAISARERERNDLKQGINSQAVKQAIVQRQQQAQIQQQQAQQAQMQQAQMAQAFQQQQHSAYQDPYSAAQSSYGGLGAAQSSYGPMTAYAPSQYNMTVPGNRHSWAASTIMAPNVMTPHPMTPGGTWNPGYGPGAEQGQQGQYFTSGQGQGPAQNGRRSPAWGGY
jgi:CCR4-NOT transcriptional complex subunit CAF120